MINQPKRTGLFLASGLFILLAVLAFAVFVVSAIISIWVADPTAFWGRMVGTSVIVLGASLVSSWFCWVLDE